MSQTANCGKLISLLEELDDGKTGFLPSPVIKAILCECGDKMKDDDFAQIAGDLDQEGMFPYKWYFEEILCNTSGLGDWKHWLKQK